MIRGALRHLHGVGPERLRQFEALGLTTWQDLLSRSDEIPLPATLRQTLVSEILQTEDAVARDDLFYLTQQFAPQDQWRVLHHAFDHAAYFDIETSGLGPDSHITVIACLVEQRLYTFVHGENLDDFLDLLDHVDLLVSFNGASFDIPQIKHFFHIPTIPCAHVDLRWVCHYEQLKGGLKSIERRLGIERPSDLHGIDGEEAVWLWEDWSRDGNRDARERLIRYCAADVVSLQLLAAKIFSNKQCGVESPTEAKLWSLLDPCQPRPTRVTAERQTPSRVTSHRRLQGKLQQRRKTSQQ